MPTTKKTKPTPKRRRSSPELVPLIGSDGREFVPFVASKRERSRLVREHLSQALHHGRVAVSIGRDVKLCAREIRKLLRENGATADQLKTLDETFKL